MYVMSDENVALRKVARVLPIVLTAPRVADMRLAGGLVYCS